jgi:pimeloyl-ACP methyl ester carboxylesterase
VPRVTCNGIELEYEWVGHPAVGNPADSQTPVILLIMGLGMQLIAWPDEFCAALVASGFRVIRFDNRDVGLSGRITGGKRPNLVWAMLAAKLRLPVRSPYTLADMAADAVGLLDALGIDRAHVVGASMGGMIAQVMAASYPQRVASLTSIMSTSGNPKLPRPRRDAVKTLVSKPSDPKNPAIVIDHLIKVFGVIGSPGFPADLVALRDQLSRAVKRAYYPAGVARQLLAVIASGDRRPLLRTITAPTLVIHGAADPLIPLAAGQDTADNIPGARLMAIEGMGHDLPQKLLAPLAEAIATHCRQSEPT